MSRGKSSQSLQTLNWIESQLFNSKTNQNNRFFRQTTIRKKHNHLVFYIEIIYQRLPSQFFSFFIWHLKSNVLWLFRSSNIYNCLYVLARANDFHIFFYHYQQTKKKAMILIWIFSINVLRNVMNFFPYVRK